MLQTKQTKKWWWMMGYCKKKQWAPANNALWTKAAEAYHLQLSS